MNFQKTSRGNQMLQNYKVKLAVKQLISKEIFYLQSCVLSLAKDLEQLYSYYVTDSHHPNETSRVSFLFA